MIPTNYTEWRHCIEIDCGITLTPAFAEERLKILQAKNEPYVIGFIKMYGQPYTNQVISWFTYFLQEQN